MRVVSLADGWTVLLDCVVWAAVGVGAGYAMHRVDPARLSKDGWLLRLRAGEVNGRLYERVGIKRWKRHLPEAGGFFAGGFDKRHLHGASTADLERFVVETRRAELTHWLVLGAAPLFVLWNPPVLAAIMIVYGLAANLPCLVTQRYNRARLQRVLARRRRREAWAARTAT